MKANNGLVSASRYLTLPPHLELPPFETNVKTLAQLDPYLDTIIDYRLFLTARLCLDLSAHRRE